MYRSFLCEPRLQCRVRQGARLRGRRCNRLFEAKRYGSPCPRRPIMFGSFGLRRRVSRTNLGFDVDELDDLRVAVGELVNLTLEVCRPEVLEVQFTVDGSELSIEGSAPAADGRVVELDSLTRQILDAFLDTYTIGIADGNVCFTCTLRPG